jgi:hypothetical protein
MQSSNDSTDFGQLGSSNQELARPLEKDHVVGLHKSLKIVIKQVAVDPRVKKWQSEDSPLEQAGLVMFRQGSVDFVEKAPLFVDHNTHSHGRNLSKALR